MSPMYRSSNLTPTPVAHVLLILALNALTPATQAQGTRADYERAAQIASQTQNTVFRDRVRPRWIEPGPALWYRVQTGPQSHEFIHVDAAAGRRRLAFDHARLAAALRQAGVTNAEATRLPLDRLEFPAQTDCVMVLCQGQWWRWDPQPGSLQPQPDRLPPAAPRRARLPRASLRTGPETSLTFLNLTSVPVQLVWLDPEGERRAYATLQPGERHTQHTYAGHAWLAVHPTTGQVLLGVEADEEPLTVRIEAESEAPPAPAAATPPKRAESPPGRSPDGQWDAFVRDHNLWLRRVDSSQEQPLSADGTPEAAYKNEFHWSPDSRKLAALRVLQGEQRKVYLVESSPKDQLQPKLHSYDYLKPGDRVPREQPRLFHVPQQAVALDSGLFDHPWEISDLHWRPDSSRFTFVYNQRGHQTLRVISIDAATGAAQALVEEQSPTFIDYAGKFFLHHLDATRELIWMSERDGWNHLYLVDADSGRVKHPITRGPWIVRNVDHVDAERRQIWFRAGGIQPDQDPYHVHCARVNFDGSDLVVLTQGDGTHQAQFSPDRRWFVDTWSRADLPPVTELRSAVDGRLVCELERADWSALLKTGWRPPERFVAKGRDGITDIHGIIHRPSRFKTRRKYPVIESIYAGPQSAHVPKAFSTHTKIRALAELGFIIVQIDGMGTSERSKAFHDVCWTNLADAGFPDRKLWIQAAAARYPQLDLTRVGIYGGSAGGQNALGALLFHSDFYHVAVADCGCHDNRMDKIWWNELWMGWPVGSHYAENSNVTHAHRLQGKLLLIVGELDRNVDPASTLQVANALIRADKDFDLLLIPGAGHGAAESPYGTRRRMDFFVRHLLGVEPRSH